MLTDFSNQLADAVAAVAPSVVQVQGGRRPASGVVYDNQTVLTTARALGREEGLRVLSSDGAAHDAELAGWDPATDLAVVRVAGLKAPSALRSDMAPRVGHLALALARSWSNALTASAGIIAVIGGPLRTSRRGTIEEVIRTTAPMHDGFSGGAFVDASGRLIGIPTGGSIRALGVVIPASIAWKTAAHLLEHGRARQGHLGIAGQRVVLTPVQRGSESRDAGVVVMHVTADSPAALAGLLVGDIILRFDGKDIEGPDDLLDLLSGDRVGRSVPLRILRGTNGVDLSVLVAERQAR